SFFVRHCSVGEVADLWSSVNVLLWTIWYVKQCESRLNRGRLGKRWLYLVLVTDIIITLRFTMLLIQKPTITFGTLSSLTVSGMI
ncbi:hypothetical protein F443_01247, partial [Phytophthora nicotianae P1569]